MKLPDFAEDLVAQSKTMFEALNYRKMYREEELAEANKDFQSKLNEILASGHKLRAASFDYSIDYDTKEGRWMVFLRWFPIGAG